RISGVSEAQLRQTLMDRRRPPALLTDTLRRLMLTDASQYHALQPRLSVQGRLLARQFDLPAALVEEIVGAATAQELDTITRTARVPLRLAEEARLYQQQVRIARACEGLYQDLDANPDSARLLLHLLETLPEWSAKLRVNLYEGTPDGRLLASIGPDQEPALTLLWRGQLPQAFCQDLLTAIPEFGNATTLRERLQSQPLPPRQRLRKWLGLPAHKPAFRSPMRLADGRIGLPLSGRPDLLLTDDTLLDKLRLLELEDIHAEEALQALYRSGLDRVAVNARLDGLLDEMRQLRESLEPWRPEAGIRERLEQALWQFWRSSLLAELDRPTVRLELWQVPLQDLPPALPAFLRQRVRALLLNDVLPGEEGLQAMALQFPEVGALDIRSGQWSVGLVPMIARAWPRLGSLGLHVPGVVLDEQDLRALAGLPRLRWLDLAGMRIADLPATALDGLTLDFLGLDWLDLRSWPQWLSNAALGRIGELSLMGNRLSEIPGDLLNSADVLARRQRIVLRGNRFSLLSLLDLRLVEVFLRRFSFDLDPSPLIDAQLQAWIEERRQFQRALSEWIEAARATPEPLEYRRRIARSLLGCWRESLNPDSNPLLSLAEVSLDDLPGLLPGFLSARLRRLSLRQFSAEPGSLERFVGQFPHLVEISLVDGALAPAGPPTWLEAFGDLRELVLVRLDMTIDQAAMDVFARLPQLSVLLVDGNRLGEISDMSMFAQHYLTYLGLSQMQIASWPAWLDQMLPGGIERLDLDDNQLAELPERILANRRTPDGVTEISLHNNPLSRDILIRLHTSQHFSRPFSFDLDLPDEIAGLGYEMHTSDSDSEASEPLDNVIEDEDPFTLWHTGEADADARNRQLWNGLAAGGDSAALLGLVSRLRYSADYRSPVTRDDLVQRVWNVLAAAADDSGLRSILDGMAEEPLQQFSENETCPDGIRLEFNQMELTTWTRQALRQITEENRGPALFRLMRSLFRSQALDRIARDNSNGRDEAEVRLAYRLNRGADLQLPLPPRGMLYRGVADIAFGELDQAVSQVLREEAGTALLAFGAQCDFWVAYLREAFAARFAPLKEAYEAAVLGAVDAHPDESPEQTATRIRALEEKFRQDEQALLESLTLDQYLATR
ncbi:MAG: hypothetical protein LBJ37_19965, partial [Paucimonas sp.]|nr:hypothetical protein [Paucimonas sp.]